MPNTGIQLVEATDLRQLRQFVDFPHRLYRGNPYWVPALRGDELNTLRRDRNPAFEFCEARYWLALRGGQVVGRISGILNQRHIEKWGQRYMRFGWIDFIDDEAVCQGLVGAVEAWAREKGMQAVHGPLGFTDLDREGMLVEGYDEPATLATIYNHPYYPHHLEKDGYIKDIDWVEYEMPVPGENEKIARLADTVMRRNRLHLLEVTHKRQMLKYADALFELLQEAYSHLYGFTPLSRRQVDAYIRQYFGFISPEFVPVVMDEDDKMVAFGITLPSLSSALQQARGRLLPFGCLHLLHALKHNDRADLYLVAIREDFQGLGVNAILIQRMIEVFNRMGIRTVESNPELENNIRVQAQWKHFERRQHKRRRCFIKYLD